MHKVNIYTRDHVYTHFTSKLLTKFGAWIWCWSTSVKYNANNCIKR